jgi:hypothetical protein
MGKEVEDKFVVGTVLKAIKFWEENFESKYQEWFWMWMTLFERERLRSLLEEGRISPGEAERGVNMEGYDRSVV